MSQKRVRRGGEEEDGVTAESKLAPQLGTDELALMKGKYDIRLLTKINEIEKVWLSHFLMVPDEDGGEYARKFCDNYVHLAPSEGGWRVNKMIQMVSGARGAPTVGVMRKPGWLGRNVTNRKYKEKAEERGMEVVE